MERYLSALCMHDGKWQTMNESFNENLFILVGLILVIFVLDVLTNSSSSQNNLKYNVYDVCKIVVWEIMNFGFDFFYHGQFKVAIILSKVTVVQKSCTFFVIFVVTVHINRLGFISHFYKQFYLHVLNCDSKTKNTIVKHVINMW